MISAAQGQTGRWEATAVSKNDELCIKNEKLCIKHDESCIKNDELCIETDELCSARATLAVLLDAAAWANTHQLPGGENTRITTAAA